MPTENKIRLTALIVFLLTFSFICNHSVFIPLFLVIDFGLRGFGYGKWSFISFISEKLIHILSLEEKPIYFPPKQFAAKVGFVFSITILVLKELALNTYPISFILIICAGLEAFFNFCVGCYVYNFFCKIKNKK